MTGLPAVEDDARRSWRHPIVRVALRDHLSRVDGDRRSSHGRLFPCVCCGYVTLSQRNDSYEICSICFWEDEKTALRWPRDPSGGANHVSLKQAQRNFATFRASERRVRQLVRPPGNGTLREPGFRPLDPRRDRVERQWERPWRDWPQHIDAFYWWRPTYWLRTR
ncbi:CPCC family cysteine-rich protein [Microbacterium sp. Leaf203]|uniref:CPCC family cysteine-rich protein n=1 Tax=Microbacterium sp. Leaf203 TaxID=1735677 RepID=UPI0009E99B72